MRYSVCSIVCMQCLSDSDICYLSLGTWSWPHVCSGYLIPNGKLAWEEMHADDVS